MPCSAEDLCTYRNVSDFTGSLLIRYNHLLCAPFLTLSVCSVSVCPLISAARPFPFWLCLLLVYACLFPYCPPASLLCLRRLSSCFSDVHCPLGSSLPPISVSIVSLHASVHTIYCLPACLSAVSLTVYLFLRCTLSFRFFSIPHICLCC